MRYISILICLLAWTTSIGQIQAWHPNSKPLDYTGWAEYKDTIYTSIAPFSVSDNNKVTLPNGAHSKLEIQMPPDVVSFYNSVDSTITGRNGDGLLITIEFVAEPTSVSTQRLYVSIDIGGTVNEIYPRDFSFSKGIGVPHYYVSSFGAYSLDTWQANGGKVTVQPIGGSVEIYNIRYVITRTHKAR